MSEYWVSNKKHFCKICNCWLSNHKASIAHHERGQGHQQKLTEYFRDKQKLKETEQREKDMLQKQMRKMEVAAMASFNKDRASYDFAQTGSIGNNNNTSSSFYGVLGFKKAPPPPPPIIKKGQVEGQYSIKNQVYLQGEYFKPLLIKGFKCQAIFSEDESWHECTITTVSHTPVPNTTIIMSKYTVEFANKNISEVVDDQKIRISVPRPPSKEEIVIHATTESDTPSSISNTNPTMKDESSDDEAFLKRSWQTVSVVVRSESEELKRQEKIEKCQIKARKTANTASDREKAFKRILKLNDDDNEGEMDALGAYNPFKGRKTSTNIVYKGIELDTVDNNDTDNNILNLITSNEVTSIGSGTLFKKRKLNSNRKKKSRRIGL